MIVEIRPVTKIFLASPGGRGEPFLGPGMIKLLEHIKKTGNVRNACEVMNISYSKGWKLLKTLEKCLNFTVVMRRQGGTGGGRAQLTDAGLAFLENHRAFEADCAQAVERLFMYYYGERQEPANTD